MARVVAIAFVPRRRAGAGRVDSLMAAPICLLASLAVFIVSHVASALANSYGLLLAMRFIGAFAYAGFWAVGGSIAVTLVCPERRGRAMGVVAGGLTVAVVFGLVCAPNYTAPFGRVCGCPTP